ncbi:MAG: hypothetical protein Kow0059_08780 [Candidatus Sumerlaeia bacterium]
MLMRRSLKLNGVTLLELMCLVAMTAVLAVGFARGLTVLRQLQYRADSVARLTAAATEVMEEWKGRARAGEVADGVMKVTAPGLHEGDALTLEIRRVDGEPGLQELILRATNSDPRRPLLLEWRTFVAVFSP